MGTDDIVKKKEEKTKDKKDIKEGDKKDDPDSNLKKMFDSMFNKTTKEKDVEKFEKETEIGKEGDISVDVNKIHEATDIKQVDISLNIKKIVQDAFNVDTDGNINKKEPKEDAKEVGDVADVKADVEESKEKKYDKEEVVITD